ncbi:hypothetical protein VPHD148_0249 [Vibrio phage D148]
MNKKWLVITLVMIGVCSVLGAKAGSKLADMQIQHAAESKCVAGLIAQEVERIDISTANGKCWEEENGYYN